MLPCSILRTGAYEQWAHARPLLSLPGSIFYHGLGTPKNSLSLSPSKIELHLVAHHWTHSISPTSLTLSLDAQYEWSPWERTLFLQGLKLCFPWVKREFHIRTIRTLNALHRVIFTTIRKCLNDALLKLGTGHLTTVTSTHGGIAIWIKGMFDVNLPLQQCD